MATIIGGMATSHAFALMDPTAWPAFLDQNRKFYQRRFGYRPELDPKALKESMADNQRRYEKIRSAHQTLAQWLVDKSPDVLILIGDDQNENFTEQNLPALALYTGERFVCRDSDQNLTTYHCPGDLAAHLMERLVEEGFEPTSSKSFPDEELKAHAFGPVLRKLHVGSRTMVLPIFVTAIYWPAPSPKRCVALGAALRRAIQSWNPDTRIALCASGGLSHFTGAFPYPALGEGSGKFYGTICEEFDHHLLGLFADGRTFALATFSSRELLEKGDVEARSWMVAAGLMGEGARATILAYEPFYSAIMGMGVAQWV